jgi:hypothetical protein
MAIGKTEISSASGVPLIPSARSSRRSGAPLEHHIEGDHEQHDTPGQPESAEADSERAEQRLAKQCKEQQDAPGDDSRSDRHLSPVSGVRSGGQ